MLFCIILIALALASVVIAVPTEYIHGNSATETYDAKQSLLKRDSSVFLDSWMYDSFSLGVAIGATTHYGTDLFFYTVKNAVKSTSPISYPLNTHDSVSFIPEKTSFYGSLTGEQAAHYMSSRDRLPKTPPSTGCYDVYSYADKPLCLHVKNGFTYVNCARITKYIRSNNNAIFLIDRMLDPKFNDYGHAKNGTCLR